MGQLTYPPATYSSSHASYQLHHAALSTSWMFTFVDPREPAYLSSYANVEVAQAWLVAGGDGRPSLSSSGLKSKHANIVETARNIVAFAK